MAKKSPPKGRLRKKKVSPKRKSVPKEAGGPVSTKRGRGSRGKTPSRRKTPAKRSTRRVSTRSVYRFKNKRTYQLTAKDAKEKILIRPTKGKLITSNSDNARKLLTKALKGSRSKFSRKRADRYAASIALKWKGEDGKWRTRTLTQVSDSFEEAIEKLLQQDEINSLTYETTDRFGQTEEKKIHSKTKKIVGLSFDKYVERTRKIPKTVRKKAIKKKPRSIRHRK